MSVVSDLLPSVTSNSIATSSAITTPFDRRERQINYKKTIASTVHRINCRCLYRVLMKIEIPFRGANMKTIRHRFIKILYENSFKDDPDYAGLITFIKQHLGLYVSIFDVRQLVLYSALFGDRNKLTPPSNNEIREVIKRCPLAVPPFTFYNKWSKDLKKLEKKPFSEDLMKVIIF